MLYVMIYFVEDMLGIYYVTIMICDMIDMCTIWILMSESMKTL